MTICQTDIKALDIAQTDHVHPNGVKSLLQMWSVQLIHVLSPESENTLIFQLLLYFYYFYLEHSCTYLLNLADILHVALHPDGGSFLYFQYVLRANHFMMVY